MFNLEQAILEWRRQMLAAGLKSPVPLEELESHLREDVEARMKSGMEARRAFETAVGRIGQPHKLKGEFRKVCRAVPKSFFSFGLCGISIVVVLNLIARFVFGRGAAEFFSEDWWTVWFPNYLVWLTFLIIGFGYRKSRQIRSKKT